MRGRMSMDLTEIEKKLVELDRELHDILRIVEGSKRAEDGLVDSVSGGWGYDVDSLMFVRSLRKTNRI